MTAKSLTRAAAVALILAVIASGCGGVDTKATTSVSGTGSTAASPSPGPAPQVEVGAGGIPPIESFRSASGDERLCWSDEGNPWEFGSSDPAVFVEHLQSNVTSWALIDSEMFSDAVFDKSSLSYAISLEQTLPVQSRVARVEPLVIQAGSYSVAALQQDYSSVVVPLADTSALADVLVQSTNGTWTFINACGDPAMASLRRLVEESLVSTGIREVPVEHAIFELVSGIPVSTFDPNASELPASTIDAIAVGLSSVVAENEVIEADWDTLDPSIRSVPDAPAETIGRYTSRRIGVVVPSEWSGDTSVSVCSRTESAWGACVALDFKWDAESPQPYLPLDAYTLAGESIDVVLLDGIADPQGHARVLGTITASELSGREASTLIEVTLRSDASPIAALYDPRASVGLAGR